MSIKQFPGGIVTKNPTAPSGPYETSTAPGIWTLDQVANYKKQGIWPTAGRVAPPTVIGQAYQGGFYAGQIGVSSVATHYLVVGPKASAQNNSRRYKTTNTGGDPTSAINGPANSAAMNDASYPAAFFCEGLSIGGYTDWYLPAVNELEVCYYNLKGSTTSNYTGTAQGGNPPRASGINANAVPARASGYTAGTPAQTSATDFQTGNAEDFGSSSYWSSTEVTSNYAWFQLFSTGRQYSYGNQKTDSLFVRAIRRVAV
jgi:Protein of unknown function (DUF1566)